MNERNEDLGDSSIIFEQPFYILSHKYVSMTILLCMLAWLEEVNTDGLTFGRVWDILKKKIELESDERDQVAMALSDRDEWLHGRFDDLMRRNKHNVIELDINNKKYNKEFMALFGNFVNLCHDNNIQKLLDRVHNVINILVRVWRFVLEKKEYPSGRINKDKYAMWLETYSSYAATSCFLEYEITLFLDQCARISKHQWKEESVFVKLTFLHESIVQIDKNIFIDIEKIQRGLKARDSFMHPSDLTIEVLLYTCIYGPSERTREVFNLFESNQKVVEEALVCLKRLHRETLSRNTSHIIDLDCLEDSISKFIGSGMTFAMGKASYDALIKMFENGEAQKRGWSLQNITIPLG